eukprot:366517-Chlamydomonas_euryale.AAC.11
MNAALVLKKLGLDTRGASTQASCGLGRLAWGGVICSAPSMDAKMLKIPSWIMDWLSASPCVRQHAACRKQADSPPTAPLRADHPTDPAR